MVLGVACAILSSGCVSTRFDLKVAGREGPVAGADLVHPTTGAIIGASITLIGIPFLLMGQNFSDPIKVEFDEVMLRDLGFTAEDLGKVRARNAFVVSGEVSLSLPVENLSGDDEVCLVTLGLSDVRGMLLEDARYQFTVTDRGRRIARCYGYLMRPR
jgi:hypothetical protein